MNAKKETTTVVRVYSILSGADNQILAGKTTSTAFRTTNPMYGTKDQFKNRLDLQAVTIIAIRFEKRAALTLFNQI